MARTLSEKLADITTAEVLELVAAHPELITVIGNHDPRVKLMEHLESDAEARKAIRVHAKRLNPGARVIEVDLPAEYEAKLAERDERIKKLEQRLDNGEKNGVYAGFRDKIRRHAILVADSEEIEDKTVDEIIEFMRDNDFGEKSAAVAVEKFYESKAPATPTLTDSPMEPTPGDSYVDKLFKAGPSDDLYAIAMPDIERMFAEEFNGSPRKRRPAMA